MTTTRSALEWRPRAQRLADQLVASGDIQDERWHAAVAAVPRHLLVPTAYEQDQSGRWTPWSTVDDLDRVTPTGQRSPSRTGGGSATAPGLGAARWSSCGCGKRRRCGSW